MMIRKIGNKTINDININNIDLNKHTTVIKEGTKLYRIVSKGQSPLIPTGKAQRFAKQPPQYTPERYRSAWESGISVSVGTGACCYCVSLPTAKLEVDNKLEDKDIFEIILKRDIELVDMDSICKSEGVNKPYITEERTEIWHQFYGKEIKGLRYESSKNPNDYNIVIFPDWFPDFKGIVELKKVNE